MTTNVCLNSSSQSQQHKLLIDHGQDKTRSIQNTSKFCQNCRLIKQELQAEIFLLKDKSHQSFMQVIQVQQLHQEELELLRAEHAEEITSLNEKNLRLTKQLNKIKDDLMTMQKNSKHHICELTNDNCQSFLIDNIDLIKCQIDQQGKQQPSRLDDSQLCQFNQIIINDNKNLPSYYNQNYQIKNKQFVPQNNNTNLNNEQILLRPKSQLFEVSSSSYFVHHNSESILLRNEQQCMNMNLNMNHFNSSNCTQLLMEEKVSVLNLRILQLQSEVQSLFETNQQLKKQCAKLQLSEKASKHNYESLYKQSKFMADHIRTLANDKFKLQRRVKQLQKEMKGHNAKALKKSMTFDDRPVTITGRKSCNLPSQINRQENQNKGSGLFASQDMDWVKNSQQNSLDLKDMQQMDLTQHHITISKVVSIANLNEQKKSQVQNNMVQSEFLHVNREVETRKSLPSYKKVSHISPSPSFKKPTPKNHNELSPAPQFSKAIYLSARQLKQEKNDGSDFMQEIRRQIEKKTNTKKSPLNEIYQAHKPYSLFHDIHKKRSNTKI